MTPEHSFKKILTTILLMVVSATVGGGSVYYGLKTANETETEDLQNKVSSLQSQLAQLAQTEQSTATPAPTPSETPSPTPSVTPTPTATNILDVTKAKVGDKVGELTIKTIAAFSKSSGALATDNARVDFTGEVSLTGKYEYITGGAFGDNDQICFHNLDSASQAKMPLLSKDDTTYLCFSNLTLAKSLLGGKGSKGDATLTLKNYELVGFPSEVHSTAELVKVTSKK